MAEVKLKEEPELWEPAEVDNSVVGQITKDSDSKGVQGLKKSGPSLVHIKEEPEELKIKQEPLQEFPFIHVIVKSEDEKEEEESSLLHQTLKEGNREDTDAAEPGLEKHSESEREEHTEDSSDTDDSEDWTPSEKSHGPQTQALVHTRPKLRQTFKCTVCTKEFKTNHNLNIHTRTHTERRFFKCTVCAKEFTTNTNLKIHLVTHTGEKPFSCSVCGKEFTQKGNLKIHMRTHTGERPFSCSVCHKSFGYSNSLQQHLRRHTEVEFSCP